MVQYLLGEESSEKEHKENQEKWMKGEDTAQQMILYFRSRCDRKGRNPHPEV